MRMFDLQLRTGALAIAATAALAGPAVAQGAKTPIKIGALFELTGVFASSGVYGAKSVQAYAAAANAAGGMDGHPIEVVVVDNQSKPDVAIASLRKLVNEDKVHAVICCNNSPIAIALKPLSKQLGVPVFAAGQSPDVINPPEQAEFMFRPNFPVDTSLRQTLEAIKKSGTKSVAFLGVNNAYGTSAGKIITTMAPEVGLALTGSQFFEAASTDVKAQLTLLRSGRPDAIVVYAIGPQATLVSKNLQELAFTAPVYHSMGAANQEFVRDGGTAVEGSHVSASVAMVPVAELPANHPVYKLAKQYSDAWQSTNKMAGDEFGRGQWDAMNIIALALEAKKPDLSKPEEARRALRDGIETVRGYAGLTGTFNFSPQDHSGLGTSGGALLVIRNGKFTLAN